MFQDQQLPSVAGQRKIKTIIVVEEDEAISEVLQFALKDGPSYYTLLCPILMKQCESPAV